MMTSEMQSKLVVLKIESFLKQEIEKILEKNIIDDEISEMIKILDVNEEYLRQLYIKNLKISNMEKIKSLNDINNVSYEFIFGLKKDLSNVINTNTLFKIFVQKGEYKFEVEINNANKNLNITESDINSLMISQRILATIILIKINAPVKKFIYCNINKQFISREILEKALNNIKKDVIL